MTERVTAFEATPQRSRINSRASESEFLGSASRIETVARCLRSTRARGM